LTTVRTLLWDFDGTLGYRPGMWTQAMLDVLREHDPSCTLTRYDFRPFLHGNLPWQYPQNQVPHPELATQEQWWSRLEAVLARAFIGVGRAPSEANRLAQLAHKKYLDKSQWFLFEDVIPTLQKMCVLGWRQAILSNHVPELAEIVEAMGLSPYIQRVFSSALLGYEKPQPQIFRQALAALGHPQTIWMIGDNIEADVFGAQAVGIPAILVRKEDQRAIHACADLSAVVEFFAAQTASLASSPYFPLLGQDHSWGM
jgi:putative hydrolase of the HAD superfamily